MMFDNKENPSRKRKRPSLVTLTFAAPSADTKRD